MESFWTQWTDSVAMLHQWIICRGVTSQWHKGAPLSVSKLGIEGKWLHLLFRDPWEGFSPPGTLSELSHQGEKMAPDSHLWIYHLWTRAWVRAGKKVDRFSSICSDAFLRSVSEVAASRTDVTHREVSQSMHFIYSSSRVWSTFVYIQQLWKYKIYPGDSYSHKCECAGLRS